MDNSSPENQVDYRLFGEPRWTFGGLAMVVGAVAATASAVAGVDIHHDTLVIKPLVETGAEVFSGSLFAWMGYNMIRGRELLTGMRGEQ